MSHFTTTMPTMKEIEQWIFRKMQEEFARAMKQVLEALDRQILEQRKRQIAPTCQSDEGIDKLV